MLRIGPDAVGSVLASAYVISLAGAALAAGLDVAGRCRRLAVFGHVALGLALVPFAAAAGLGSFVLFAVLLQLAWAFTAPLLMSLVAKIEPAGSMMPSATFVVGAGLMVGPLLGGYLFELQDGVKLLSLCCAAVLVLSAMLLTFGRRTVQFVDRDLR